MDNSELVDTKNALLSLYSDNALQYAGLGVGVAVILVTEVSVKQDLPTLFDAFNLLSALISPTLIFGFFMFMRSAFWGRMTYVLVAESKPISVYSKTEDPMSVMYIDHLNRMSKSATRRDRFLFRVGYTTYLQILIVCAASTLFGFVVLLARLALP